MYIFTYMKNRKEFLEQIQRIVNSGVEHTTKDGVSLDGDEGTIIFKEDDKYISVLYKKDSDYVSRLEKFCNSLEDDLFLQVCEKFSEEHDLTEVVTKKLYEDFLECTKKVISNNIDKNQQIIDVSADNITKLSSIYYKLFPLKSEEE